MATEVGSVELGVKLNDNLEKDVAKVANKADSILTGRFNAIGATIGKSFSHYCFSEIWIAMYSIGL